MCAHGMPPAAVHAYTHRHLRVRTLRGMVASAPAAVVGVYSELRCQSRQTTCTWCSTNHYCYS